jgi:hypothetical protein
MSIKFLSIPDNNPFENDALSREKYIKDLTELLPNLNNPSVLSLDSPWGTGKTTFIRMWKQYLINNNFNCLYFNAWETDFSRDPFVSLIGEFNKLCENLNYKDNIGLNKSIAKIKKSAILITKKSIPLIINLATSGIIKIDENTEKQLSEFAETIAKEQIDNYDKQKLNIDKFKNNLSEAIQKIVNLDSNKRPVIIFIDELDRCRPTYSIELLECAKHLFDVHNIIFIITIDKPQLMASIKSIYGNEFNSEGYLKRFIDYDFLLPEPQNDNFCKFLFKEIGINEYFEKRHINSRKQDLESIYEIFSNLFIALNFSLREQIQIVSRLGIILKSIPINHLLFKDELAIMIVLRSWKPDLYNLFIHGKLDPKIIINSFKEIPDGIKFLNSHIGLIIEGVLLASAYNIGVESSLIKEYKNVIIDNNISSEIKQKKEKILEIMKWCKSGMDDKLDLTITASRIEFSEMLRVR